MFASSRIALSTLLMLGGIAPTVAAQELNKEDVPFNEGAPQVPDQDAPERTLLCTVHHATNIDPTKAQAESDIVYGQTSQFTLILGAGHIPKAVGVGTADPGAAPDPSYKIASDPQNLFAMAGPTFDRVADYWPRHVEVGKTIMGKAFSFILLDALPDTPGAMSAFVSRAADAVTVDVSWIHRGTCTIQPSS